MFFPWKKAFTPYKSNYGYGWFVGPVHGRKCVWHTGGTYGFASHLAYFPDDDLTVILLDNILGGPDQALLPVEDLAAIALNKPYQLYKEMIK